MKTVLVKCCGRARRLFSKKDRYPGTKHEDRDPLPTPSVSDDQGRGTQN